METPKYSSFVCYRRKEGHPKFAPSENVAGLIWWWLEHSDETEWLQPALFQECCADGEIRYDNAGIKRFIPNVRKVFIVICAGGFKNLIDIYQESLRTIDITKGSESAGECARRKIEQTPGVNILYYEIKNALDNLNPVDIVPVYIKNDATDYVLSDADKQVLVRLFGDSFESVIYSVNHAIYFPYNTIAGEFETFSWNPASIKNSKPDEKVKMLEKVDSVKNFKAEIISKCQEPPSPKAAEKRADMLSHLQRCSETVHKARKPHVHDKSNELDGIKSSFTAQDKDIIYDPVRLRDPQSKPPYLAQCMLDAFNTYKDAFALENDRFCYWDVDLDPENNSFSGLSVCAICFGTLIMKHRKNKDNIVLPQDSRSRRRSDASYVDVMNAGMNLLIALRDPDKYTWPSLWVFDDSCIDVQGTVNQTTLSLATLLGCGFLKVEENNPLNYQQLQARVEFIWQSAAVLLKSGVTYEGIERAWGYKIDSDPRTSSTALAFTVFVFDTFLKLRKDLIALEEHFRHSELAERIAYADKLKEYVNSIDECMQGIMEYFYNAQSEINGSFYKFGSSDDHRISDTHTAYVIKSLCTYLAQNKSDFSPKIEKTDVDHVLEKATKPFLERIGKMLRTRGEFPKDERFEMDSPDSGDQYEHCSELIVAEALIKIVESKGNEHFDKSIDDEDRNIARRLLEQLLGRYVESVTQNYRDKCIYIEGHQESPKYPIYYIYYYRMVLLDYLLLLKKEEENAKALDDVKELNKTEAPNESKEV